MAEVYEADNGIRTEPIRGEPPGDWREIEKGVLDDIFQSDEDGSVKFATPPMYVTSVGRGLRKRPDPRDIRLPRIYLNQLRLKTPSESTRPVGRGKVLQTFTGKMLPGRIHGQDAVQTNLQNPPHVSLPLDKNFLGAATRGLTSEILEGKACLMEKFLGKPMMEHEGFNPFAVDQQHAPRSLRSSQTAPVLNLKNRDQWPGINDAMGCQSDGGQRGPTKILSLQDALNTISAASSWDKSSQDGSRGGSGEGSRKWRRMKRRQGGPAQDGSHDKEASKTSTSGGAAASSVSDAAHLETASGDRSSGDGLSGTSRKEERGIPSGPNLIQVECLPENITEQRLTAVMYGFGPVVACKILRDSDSQNCIGIAFVRFETSEACLSAISALHGEDSPFHDSIGDKETPKLLIHLVT